MQELKTCFSTKLLTFGAEAGCLGSQGGPAQAPPRPQAQQLDQVR